MGRKTVQNPKAHRMTLRFTATELLTAREAAYRAGLSLSDYARRAIARPPGQHHPRTKAARRAIDAGVEMQLRRVGTNLNQIAHRLNAQDLPAPPELPELLNEIRSILAKAALIED